MNNIHSVGGSGYTPNFSSSSHTPPNNKKEHECKTCFCTFVIEEGISETFCSHKCLEDFDDGE